MPVLPCRQIAGFQTSTEEIHNAVVDNPHEFKPVNHFATFSIGINHPIYGSAALAMELVIDLLALVTWPMRVRSVWMQGNAFIIRVVYPSREPLKRKINLVGPGIAKDLRVAAVKSDLMRLNRVGGHRSALW